MDEKTISYYNTNSSLFTNNTKDIEFSSIPEHFLQYLNPDALILDLGCGSGRDSRYFIQKGYRTEAADGSLEMVRIASETAGIPVRHMYFNELEDVERFDGIFACASLLHVPYDELPDIFKRIRRALKPEGIAYVSFKYGSFEGYRNERYFTDLNEERFTSLLDQVKGFSVIDQWISSDARPGRENEKWLNAIIRKKDD